MDSEGPTWPYLAAGVVLAALFLGFYAGTLRNPETVSSSGFDLSSVTPSARPALNATRDEIRTSPRPVIGGAADAPGSAPADGGPSAAGAGAATASVRPLEGRARETAFLARHGAELKSYHTKLAGVALRYRKTHKVVAEVDMAFAGMPRYMAVKTAYDRSGDPYSFARDALALPEVRAEISKRLKEPAVWSAALGMITDTMRSAPPPKSLYEEALDFMGREPEVARHVEAFTQEANLQAPAIAMAIPKNADINQLQKLVGDGNAALAKRR